MANKIVREIIHAKGIDIGIYTKDFENEYISLTDIAKYRNDNDPRFVIQMDSYEIHILSDIGLYSRMLPSFVVPS